MNNTTKKTDNVTVKSYSINPTFTLSEFRAIQEYVIKNVGRMSNGKVPSFKWARELILKEVGLLKSKMEISSPVKALGVHIKTSYLGDTIETWTCAACGGSGVLIFTDGTWRHCPHGILETKKENNNE